MEGHGYTPPLFDNCNAECQPEALIAELKKI